MGRDLAMAALLSAVLFGCSLGGIGSVETRKERIITTPEYKEELRESIDSYLALGEYDKAWAYARRLGDVVLLERIAREANRHDYDTEKIIDMYRAIEAYRGSLSPDDARPPAGEGAAIGGK